MTGWQSRRIVSRLAADGRLEVTLEPCRVPPPEPDELVIRVDSAPINPADVKTLFCGVAPDRLTPVVGGLAGQVPAERLAEFSGRIDAALPAGNEGTGNVIAAGSDPAAQALLGRRIAAAPGAMFCELRTLRARDCLALPDGTPAELAAAAWINPMTALAMIETMRREGHHGLVLTAAGSSLGQMLARLCRREAVPLVCIVRSAAGVARLRAAGITHALASSAGDFDFALEQALAETGATLAFDATGGGTLAGSILRAMERSQARTGGGYSRYGSTVHKQLYFFGGLDPAPVSFSRDFGMAWGMGGWLLQTALARFGEETTAALKARVVDGLGDLFVTRFARRIGLDELLAPEAVASYARLATDGKTLVCP